MPDETPDPTDADVAENVLPTDETATDETVTDETATEESLTDETTTDETTTEETASDETATEESLTDEGAADDGNADVAAIDRDDTPPPAVVDEAERLTRLAREAVDDAEADAYSSHREQLLAEHDYTARVREDDTRDVLVLHPDEWVENGTVRTERIDDIGRGIEVPLSGPGEGDDWAEIDAHNRDIVEDVRDEHGETHAANAAALADFAGNHYAKPVESLTADELDDFLHDYFLRNAWPTDEQREIVEKSVALAFEAVDERCPLE